MLETRFHEVSGAGTYEAEVVGKVPLFGGGKVGEDGVHHGLVDIGR